MTALTFKQHVEIQSQFFTRLFNNPNSPRESIKEFVEGFMVDKQQEVTFEVLSNDDSVMARYTRLMYILTIAIYAETSSNALFDMQVPKYFEKLCLNEPVCRNLLTQSMDIQFKEIMNIILNVDKNIDVCHGYRIVLTLLYLYYIRLYYQHAEFKMSPLVSAQNAVFVENFYNKSVPIGDLRETTSMVHVQFIIVQFAIVAFYLYTNFITVYYRESDEQCVEVQKAFQTVCKVVEVDIASKASENFKELVMTVGYHFDKRYRVLNTIRRMGYSKDGYIRYLQIRGKFVMNQYFNMDCAYQYMGPVKKYVAGQITYSEYFKRFVHFEDTFPFYSLHRFEAFRKKINQLALGYNAMGYYKGKVISFGKDIKNFITAPFCTTWAIIVGIYNFIAVNATAACDDVSQAYSEFKVAGVRFQSQGPIDMNQDEDYILRTQAKDMAITWMCKPIFIINYALRSIFYLSGKTIGASGDAVRATFLQISALFERANTFLVTEPARKVPKIDKIAGRKVILRPLENASRPAMLVVAFDRFGVEPTRVFQMHKLPVVVGNSKDSNVLPTPDDLVGGKKRLFETILDIDKTVENERILDIIRDAQHQRGGDGSEEDLQNMNPKDIKPVEDVSIDEMEDYFYNHTDEIDIKQNALSMTLGYHIQEIPEFVVNKMDIDAMKKRCEDMGVKYVGPTFSDYTMVPLSIPNEKDCAKFIPAPNDKYESSGMFVLPIVKELEQVLNSINLPAIVPMAR